MKIRQLTLLLFLIATSVKSQAQDVSFLMGKPVEIDKNNDFFYVGFNDKEFYVINTATIKRKTTGVLQGFSRTTLDKTFEVPLEVPVENSEKISVQGAIPTGNKIRVFYSFYDDRAVAERWMIADFNMEGKLSSKVTEIFNAKGIKAETFWRVKVVKDNINGATFVYKLGDAIAFACKPSFDLKIFDKNGEKVYDKTIDVSEIVKDDKKVKGINVFNVATDNNGHAIIAINYLKSSFFFGFLVIDIKSGKTSVLPLEQSDNTGYTLPVFKSGKFAINMQGSLLYSSPYCDNMFGDNLKGILTAKFDSEVNTKFSSNFSAFKIDMTGKRNPKVFLKNYKTKNVFLDNSGNPVTTLQSEKASTSIESKEIRVVTTSDKYEVDKEFIIDRKQESDKKSFGFCASLVKGDKAFVLVNESSENFSGKEDKMKKVTDKDVLKGLTSPVCITINTTGLKNYKVLFPKGDAKYIAFKEGYELNLSSTEMIGVVESDGNTSFVKIFVE